jgi:hypothetical protein
VGRPGPEAAALVAAAVTRAQDALREAARDALEG